MKKEKYLGFLGIVQILGSLLGFSALLGNEINIGVLVFIVFLGLSIYCGILLLLKKPLGIKLSKINFFLQLVGFELPDFFGFKYYLGTYFNVVYDFNINYLSWEMGLSTVFLFQAEDVSNNIISLNLFAVAVLVLLFSSEDSKIWEIELPDNDFE